MHRIDGPALSWADGLREWWLHGELHRIDGPARIHPTGVDRSGNPGPHPVEEWWLDGLIHRLDGPTLIYLDGEKRWFENDRLHLVDGPAVTRTWHDALQPPFEEWWEDGKLHRLAGPATTSRRLEEGEDVWTEAWWVRGKDITTEVLEMIEDQGYSSNWQIWAHEWLYFRLRFAGLR